MYNSLTKIDTSPKIYRVHCSTSRYRLYELFCPILDILRNKVDINLTDLLQKLINTYLLTEFNAQMRGGPLEGKIKSRIGESPFHKFWSRHRHLRASLFVSGFDIEPYIYGVILKGSYGSCQ